MKSLSLSKWKGDFHFRRYVQLNIFLLVDYLSVCCVVVDHIGIYIDIEIGANMDIIHDHDLENG